MKREELIRQLRCALALAISTREDVVEFEISEVGFSFDFNEIKS